MVRHRKKIGLAPGTVIYTGGRTDDKVYVHFLQYNLKDLFEKTLDSHSGLELEKNVANMVDWYDVRGMHDTQLIEKVGRTYQIHPIVLENIVDIYQRSSFDEYENGNFLILKALSYDVATQSVQREHVAIYFTKTAVFSFQETTSDIFEHVRGRISSAKTRIRERGTDYLAFALVDAIVDNYFLVMDELEARIELLEDQLTYSQDLDRKGDIHRLKKELLVVKKAVSPLREAISRFYKTDSELVSEANRIYIRDLYEHTIQIMDTVESYRDVLNGLQDLLITEVSFKMNKVMQLLTLISVIFIPLTFLAGIYGMNFENMPELKYRYGYFVLLGIMVVVFIALLLLFRRKKWL